MTRFVSFFVEMKTDIGILGASWRLRNLLGAKLLGYASVWLRTSLVTKSPDFILYPW